jgi:CheY-like chemotaxis protein
MSQPQPILMVDDIEDNLYLMRAAFRMAKAEHPLQEARDGEAAIAYLKGEGHYSDRNQFPLPTVMLLDLNMPKKNGFEVLGPTKKSYLKRSWEREQKRILVGAAPAPCRILLTRSRRPHPKAIPYDRYCFPPANHSRMCRGPALMFP